MSDSTKIHSVNSFEDHGVGSTEHFIQSLEKTRRNEMLISALSFGAGIRQLSRLTGVSFGVIQKLQK